MELTTIFYYTDEFCKEFEQMSKKNVLADGKGKRRRTFSLSLSEIMSIMIYFPCSGYKTFKDYYTKNYEPLRTAFPGLVSYNRFVELQQQAAIPMAIYLKMCGLTAPTGISFIDSFVLKSCHIKREHSHKTFKGLAAKGKTTVGWFYGLKIHFVITHKGDIIDFYITGGNIADNNSVVIERMSDMLFGKLFGDKGYIVGKEMNDFLLSKNIELVTKVRSNMKSKPMDPQDRLILKKRGVIESVISILKERLLIEHTRHRSTLNFFAHICSSLMAYFFRPNKPSITSEVALSA
jgi:hypothetical protein